jgi:hypothetical protein
LPGGRLGYNRDDAGAESRAGRGDVEQGRHMGAGQSRKWNAVYAAVVLFTVVVVSLLYLFSSHFSG